MKYVLVILVLAAAGAGVWYTARSGLPESGPAARAPDAWVAPNFVEPPINEISPAGWKKFRADVAAEVEKLPSHSSYRDKNPAPILFIRHATRKKKLLEAYNSFDLDERPAVFQMVADQAGGPGGRPGQAGGQAGGQDTFTQLIEAHMKAFPDDGWVKFYQAQQQSRRGNLSAAEPLYAAAAAALPNEDKVRSGWGNCLIGLGRWKDAYGKLVRERADFLRMAYAIYLKGDAAALAEVCDLHKAAVPDDPESEYYRGWAHWLKKDYAAANKTWDDYLAGPPGQGRAIPPEEYERRFRTAFRQNKTADARAYVEHTPNAAKPDHVVIWKALLAAKDGKPDEVLKALGDGQEAASLYSDRDLGPLLKSPAMAPVRAKYPPPEGA